MICRGGMPATIPEWTTLMACDKRPKLHWLGQAKCKVTELNLQSQIATKMPVSFIAAQRSLCRWKNGRHGKNITSNMQRQWSKEQSHDKHK